MHVYHLYPVAIVRNSVWCIMYLPPSSVVSGRALDVGINVHWPWESGKPSEDVPAQERLLCCVAASNQGHLGLVLEMPCRGCQDRRSGGRDAEGGRTHFTTNHLQALGITGRNYDPCSRGHDNFTCWC